MDLPSVRIAAGACAVFGGLVLATGGPVANAAPDTHSSAAADSASSADNAGGAQKQASSPGGKPAPTGGASAVKPGAKGKTTPDVSALVAAAREAVRGSLTPNLPNPAGAVPNPAGAVPNPAGATSSNTSSSNTSTSVGTAPSAGTNTPSTGLGGVGGREASGPASRVVDRTLAVMTAVESVIGAVADGSIPVIKPSTGAMTPNNGALVSGFVSGPRPSVSIPPASALSAGRTPLAPSLGYSPMPESNGRGLAGPIPTAFLTPDLVSAADAAADTLAPPVLSPAPVPGAKWLTDLPIHVREALRNASMAELLMGALPGLIGLVFFFVAGVGLGRRQAKFGFAMETTGIMRFAARGPLGIVRSNSFIAIHPPKSAGTRNRSAAHLTLVDRVA